MNIPKSLQELKNYKIRLIDVYGEFELYYAVWVLRTFVFRQLKCKLPREIIKDILSRLVEISESKTIDGYIKYGFKIKELEVDTLDWWTNEKSTLSEGCVYRMLHAFGMQKLSGLYISISENEDYPGRADFRTCKDGRFNGTSKIWRHRNRVIEENHKCGLLHGFVREWYGKQLIHESFYQNDKEDGISHRWSKNGQLQEERNFRNGHLDGWSREWHRNSNQRRSETDFQNGLRHGWVRKWYRDGQPKEKAFYEFDKCCGIKQKWDRLNRLREIEFQNGKKDGFDRLYDLDGNFIFESYYKNGRRCEIHGGRRREKSGWTGRSRADYRDEKRWWRA